MEPNNTEIWLNFVTSFIWPSVLLIIAFGFRRQFENLLSRIKSGEVAGAKLNFNEAASGFISTKLESITHENDAGKRALLAGEIKGVAETIGAIHPISLSLLIQAGNGNAAWIDSAFTRKKKYFYQLEASSLAKVVEKQDSKGKLEGSLKVQSKGKALLKEIGLYE